MAIPTSSSSSQESLHELLPYPVVATGRDPDSLNAFDLDPFSQKSSFRVAISLNRSSPPFVYKEVKRTDLLFRNDAGKPVNLTCISRDRHFEMPNPEALGESIPLHRRGGVCFKETLQIEPGEYSTPLHLRHNVDLPFSVTYKVGNEETAHLFLALLPCYKAEEPTPSFLRTASYYGDEGEEDEEISGLLSGFPESTRHGISTQIASVQKVIFPIKEGRTRGSYFSREDI